MGRNGRNAPTRPRIEMRQSTASPEEAAAIAAAIEQFLRDTAPPAAPPSRSGGWARAAMLEGVGLQPGEQPSHSSEPHLWGR